MEARFEGEAHHLFGLSPVDYGPVGRRSTEWDLNDWKWDGDLFVARQFNPNSTEAVGHQLFPVGSGIPVTGNSSNSSSSCSGEVNIERRELEKKRRVIVMDDDNVRDDAGSLTLKLGGRGYPAGERENWGANGAKKTKLGGAGAGAPNRAVCQVENCGADLSKVKDYHRRHKVCEMHSKASSALVGGIMQRFCQQCSRFHVLHEFDEGKRSCRRRLAGHNKRRRKTNPDNGGNGNPLNDDQTSSYLLISLLKILSNLHSNRTNHAGDQDLLSHLLKSLVGHAGEQLGKNLVGLLQGGPQGSPNAGTSALLTNGQAPQEDLKLVSLPTPEIPQQEAYVDGTRSAQAQDNSTKQVKMNDFDLNDIYVDSDDGTEDIERSSPPMNPATSSLDYPSWIQQDSHQSSPPQTSRNSDSASDQSPSSSSGDAQTRTDRIVFKLFGKEPNDFPVVLRGQILDWLSQSPTDMESYIRPGCIVLTIYLRQAEGAWEELCSDLSFSLSRLLDLSDDPFWTTGWIYVRVQNQIAFVFDGQVVLDTSLPLRNHNYSQIFSVRPIAVAANRRAQFTVRGINLCRRSTRLLCAIEGKYLVQEATHEFMDDSDDLKEENEIECVKLSCDMPIASGRGFMEVEDQGLSSSFFPFIVAEDDVCSEIRLLESTLEFTGTDAAKQAMDFIHEIGWLLHRSDLKSRLRELDPNADLFPFRRFKWLIEFSVDHEWCAVIRKLLNTLFNGTVSSGEGPSVDITLSEMCLLHRAVRKNSRPVVEMLLRYVPKQNPSGHETTLFRPDAAGPAGLTPLHIAAGKDGSEDVLDALTEDPGMVGIEAWNSSRDSTGFTPEDYARLRGHFSYIRLVQRKLKKKTTAEEHVVDIPASFPEDSTTKNNQKQETGPGNAALEITRPGQDSSSLALHCKLCGHKLAHGYGVIQRSLAYRPAMLSMVAIAAVCVCVALLFRGCPRVLYVFQPFRWELLEYGTS